MFYFCCEDGKEQTIADSLDIALYGNIWTYMETKVLAVVGMQTEHLRSLSLRLRKYIQAAFVAFLLWV